MDSTRWVVVAVWRIEAVGVVDNIVAVAADRIAMAAVVVVPASFAHIAVDTDPTWILLLASVGAGLAVQQRVDSFVAFAAVP